MNIMSGHEKAFHYLESKDISTEYAMIPWDDKTDTIIENNSTIKRWDFIRRQLQKRINSVHQLIDLIKSYNIIFDGNGKPVKPPWKFTALSQCFSEMQEHERNDFFKDGGILCTIVNLALQANELIPQIKLLKSGTGSCLTLHQLQIASLLACAFLCIFSKRDAEYPSINFNKLFDGADQGNPKPYIEKIKCIIHYFRRINEKQPSGNVSYYRLHINDHRFPRWDKTTASLCRLNVEIQGKIEDQEGFLQMDFANRFIGGGVLGRGCLQEEIRFVINPELIAARLFTECLSDNEALFVVGSERYCQYVGFADTFHFDGDYRDITPFDDTNHKKTYIIVLDALYFSHSSEQYRESKILRELKKAYVGYKPIEKWNPIPLATGNWGCGAFGGDPQLKSVVQLMAASQAGRDMLYLTFGDSSLKKQIDELYKILKDREINVGTLYRIIRLYGKNKIKSQTLFDFIRDMIIRKSSSVMESEILESPASDIEKNTQKCTTLSESNVHYTSLYTKIRTCSFTNKDQKFPEEPNTHETDKTTLDKVQIDSSPSIEDRNKSECRDWTFDFGDADFPIENTVKVEQEAENDVEMCEMSCGLVCSGGAEVQDSYENEPESSETGPASVGRHRILMNDFDDIKPKERKLIQTKITDCFSKK